MTKYDLTNLCSMLEIELQALYVVIDNNNIDKAKHRVKTLLDILEKIKDHESQKKKTSD